MAANLFLLSLSEGYERIARARKGIFANTEYDNLSKMHGEDLTANAAGYGAGVSSIWDRPLGVSEANTSLQVSSGDGGDEFDMFGDNEDNTNVNPLSNGTGLASVSSQPASVSLDHSQDLYSGGTTCQHDLTC